MSYAVINPEKAEVILTGLTLAEAQEIAQENARELGQEFHIMQMVSVVSDEWTGRDDLAAHNGVVIGRDCPSYRETI